MFLSGEQEQSQWLDEKRILIRVLVSPLVLLCSIFPQAQQYSCRVAFSLWSENMDL